jgi:hypothetical protein
MVNCPSNCATNVIEHNLTCIAVNNHGMAVNYHGILTLEKVGLKLPR